MKTSERTEREALCEHTTAAGSLRNPRALEDGVGIAQALFGSLRGGRGQEGDAQSQNVKSSVGGVAAVPEASPEVVAAGHEAGVGGRVDDAADDVVVAQRQQVLPLGRARVPAAQADGALVRQQHVVLRVVEHALRAVHLTAAQPSAYRTTRVRASLAMTQQHNNK